MKGFDDKYLIRTQRCRNGVPFTHEGKRYLLCGNDVFRQQGWPTRWWWHALKRGTPLHTDLLQVSGGLA